MTRQIVSLPGTKRLMTLAVLSRCFLSKNTGLKSHGGSIGPYSSGFTHCTLWFGRNARLDNFGTLAIQADSEGHDEHVELKYLRSIDDYWWLLYINCHSVFLYDSVSCSEKQGPSRLIHDLMTPFTWQTSLEWLEWFEILTGHFQHCHPDHWIHDGTRISWPRKGLSHWESLQWFRVEYHWHVSSRTWWTPRQSMGCR